MKIPAFTLLLGTCFASIPALLPQSVQTQFEHFNFQAQAAENKLVILDVIPQGNLQQHEAQRLSLSIFRAMKDQSPVPVMSRASALSRLQAMGLSSGSPCETSSCTARIGQQLDASYLMNSRVSKLNGVYHLGLQIFNTQNGQVVREIYLDYDSDFKTLEEDQIPLLINRLVAKDWSNNAPRPPIQPPIIPATPEVSEIKISKPPRPSHQNNKQWNDFWRVGRPIRTQKPFLINVMGSGVFGEAGLAPQLQGALFYNLGPYFALGLSGGMTSVAEPKTNSSGIVSLENVNLGSIEPHLRAYFNPHDLAVYADLGYNFVLREEGASTALHQFFTPQLGVEYRHQSGLNLSLSGGARLSLDNRYAPALLTQVSVGFAF